MSESNKTAILFAFIIILTISALGISIGYYFHKSSTTLESEEIVTNTETKITKSESAEYISYNVIDYERDLIYTWDFIKDKSKSIKENIMMDVNLRLNIDKINTEDTKEIDKRVTQEKLIVSFDHHGSLPLNAMVKINVENKFKDNESLYLYYYNPETQQIEFMEKNIIVKDGYATFKIDHCSDYFLTAAVVNDAVNNPKNLNYIIIGLGVVVVILIAITLVQSKK